MFVEVVETQQRGLLLHCVESEFFLGGLLVLALECVCGFNYRTCVHTALLFKLTWGDSVCIHCCHPTATVTERFIV